MIPNESNTNHPQAKKILLHILLISIISIALIQSAAFCSGIVYYSGRSLMKELTSISSYLFTMALRTWKQESSANELIAKEAMGNMSDILTVSLTNDSEI